MQTPSYALMLTLISKASQLRNPMHSAHQLQRHSPQCRSLVVVAPSRLLHVIVARQQVTDSTAGLAGVMGLPLEPGMAQVVQLGAVLAAAAAGAGVVGARAAAAHAAPHTIFVDCSDHLTVFLKYLSPTTERLTALF